MKPKLLDLFCGGGGATTGYQRAGFYVIGIDNRPQPNYPGDEFHEFDALEIFNNPLLAKFVDAVHASPPCQAYSALNALGKQPEDRPKLIEPIRKRLKALGLPYIIENVVGAPLEAPIRLCGSSFGLGVQRHRLFECSFPLLAPPCRHGKTTIGVYGEHPQVSKGMNRAKTLKEGQEAMGIDWMTWDELREAIPPAFTEYIGGELMKHLATVPA